MIGIIKDEKLTIDKDKITLTTICAGDVAYIKEINYIRIQAILDRLTQ